MLGVTCVKMRILIFGHKGWIGGMFVDTWRKLHPTHTLVLSDTRVTPGNEEALSNEISQADRVLSFIGRTSGFSASQNRYINTIDYLEDQLYENVRDNLYGVMLLALLCQKWHKHYLYLGTGCIFSWDTRQDQTPKIKDATYPDFFGSAYSCVKGFTDDLCRLFPNVCNCRIRMPIVNWEHSRNFITKIANYPKIFNMPNSMTYLPEMIPVMIHMSISEATGTYNLTNPGWIDHNTVLQLYKQYVKKDHEYMLVETERDLQLLSKRSNNVLDTHKLEEYCRQHALQCSPIVEAVEKGFQSWM